MLHNRSLFELLSLVLMKTLQNPERGREEQAAETKTKQWAFPVCVKTMNLNGISGVTRVHPESSTEETKWLLVLVYEKKVTASWAGKYCGNTFVS